MLQMNHVWCPRIIPAHDFHLLFVVHLRQPLNSSTQVNRQRRPAGVAQSTNALV